MIAYNDGLATLTNRLRHINRHESSSKLRGDKMSIRSVGRVSQ